MPRFERPEPSIESVVGNVLSYRHAPAMSFTSFTPSATVTSIVAPLASNETTGPRRSSLGLSSCVSGEVKALAVTARWGRCRPPPKSAPALPAFAVLLDEGLQRRDRGFRPGRHQRALVDDVGCVRMGTPNLLECLDQSRLALLEQARKSA